MLRNRKYKKLVINLELRLLRRPDGDFDLTWQKYKDYIRYTYFLRLPQLELKAALLSLCNKSLPVVRVPSLLEEENTSYTDYYLFCPYTEKRLVLKSPIPKTNEVIQDITEKTHLLFHFRREINPSTVYGLNRLFLTHGKPTNANCLTDAVYNSIEEDECLRVLEFITQE